MGTAGESTETSISSCGSSSGWMRTKRGSPVAATAATRATRAASDPSGVTLPMHPRSADPACRLTKAPAGSWSRVGRSGRGGGGWFRMAARTAAHATARSAARSIGSSSGSGGPGPLPGPPVPEVVRQDTGMVERQGRGQLLLTEHAGLGGVVRGSRRAARSPDVNGGDGGPARVARRIGVDAQELRELDVEGRLLAHLAPGGCLGALAGVDHAARNGPAGRRVAAPDEDDPTRELDDHVHRGTGLLLRHLTPKKKGDG